MKEDIISGLIDKYLFRDCLRLFAGLCGLVLSILLVERLIRIVEVVANSENGEVASFRMIIDLVPHYLQLAIPAALFLAMIISIDRLSRSGELVTMLSAGLSLRQLMLFYPEAMHSKSAVVTSDERISSSAQIEDGAVIEPGAIIGPEARIGRGSRIAAGAVIGYRVTIGRDCYVGPQASIMHTLVGNRVILHAGVRIGQDGFGFAMGREGHLKVPQVGRVIIQDDVEIGANSAVDRGALKDTIIGEGTKIDNLVQIGHNVVIGRHCVIVGQVGISGSTELGDFVVMGGQSGAIGHIKIGSGAQIAGGSHPKGDVPPGAVLAGTPARPFRQWAREVAAVQRLARRGGDDDDANGS